MATQTINADPKQLSSAIRVERSSSSGSVLPTIAAGEVVRVSVRQNNPGGKGLIGLKGQLLQANLPAHLAVGDTIFAEVSQTDSAVVLKLLNIKPTSGLAQLGQITELSTSLEQILFPQGSGPGARALPPFQIPTTIATLEKALEQLKDFSSQFATVETLTDPKSMLTQLQRVTDGSLATTLRESANAVRAALEQLTKNISPEQQLFSALQQQLQGLIDVSASQNSDAAQTIKDSIDRLTKELSSDLGASTKQKTLTKQGEVLLRDVLGDISSNQKNVAQLQQTIENAMLRLQNSPFALNDSAKVVDPKLLTDLRTLATKLDQMAASQEMMNQLNPLMQAVGEPALILFPFLFQGLISHSEVTVDTRSGDGKGGQHDEDEDDKSSRQEPYQRIQVKVPLPTIGTIDVDIAHRAEEIMVRFTVENPEIGGFLLEHLEGLKAILREQGFEKTELTASVGEVSEVTPAWAEGIKRGTFVIA